MTSNFAAIAYEWIDDPKVDAAMLAVLVVLVRHADFHTGKCWPSHARIAELCGKSRRWVQPQLDALVSLGIVDRDASSGSPVYTIRQPAAANRQPTATPRQPAATNKNQERQPVTTSYVEPKDFVPRDVDVEAMRKEFPHVDLDRETRKFIDWFDGKNQPISNPYQRWRNWIERSASSYNGQRSKPDRLESRRRKIAETVVALEARRNVV